MPMSFSEVRYPQFTGGGPDMYIGPEPFFRDHLDSLRSQWRRTPDAEFPDGYLGTITTRQDDKLLQGLQKRQNQRSYQRGVHKGERIDQGDYFWPREFGVDSGLRRQMRTDRRFAPLNGGAAPIVLVNDGKAGPRGVPSNDRTRQSPDAARSAQLSRLAPRYR
jgi:hypothetical protein